MAMAMTSDGRVGIGGRIDCGRCRRRLRSGRRRSGHRFRGDGLVPHDGNRAVTLCTLKDRCDSLRGTGQYEPV